MTKETAFSEADISYLKLAARTVGVEAVIPSDIRYAKALKDKGIPTPGNLDPEEAYLLLEIIKKIQAGAIAPDGFVVYLNDRGVANIPEVDVPTVLFRQTRIARNNLMNALTEVASKLKK